MLFGASIYLVGGETGDSARGALLRRRLLWLAAMALIHGLAFWYGDVLLLYAWAGLFVSLMRSLPARRLIALGLGLTLLLATLQAGLALFAAHGPAALTGEFARSQFTPEMVRQTIQAYRSGWAGARSWRAAKGAISVCASDSRSNRRRRTPLCNRFSPRSTSCS